MITLRPVNLTTPPEHTPADNDFNALLSAQVRDTFDTGGQPITHIAQHATGAVFVLCGVVGAGDQRWRLALVWQSRRGAWDFIKHGLDGTDVHAHPDEHHLDVVDVPGAFPEVDSVAIHLPTTTNL